jgi:excisionase family DNA binding protein
MAKVGGLLPSIRELEEWQTTSEAASTLGKSRQGVVWLCENRRLRGVRTRLGWLVDPKDVERYAREHGTAKKRKGDNE